MPPTVLARIATVYSNPSRGYAPWLWLLTTLFVVRVIGQPLSFFVGWSFLPRFQSWHSGVLPYPVLVLTQLVVTGWLAHTAWRFGHGNVRASSRFGLWMLTIGGVYFGVMLVRLLLVATVLSRYNRWFRSPVAAVFHLVLAAYLLVYGHFHYRHGSELPGGVSS